MGVNAKFIADFESFYAAVQKAEVSLRSFETGSAKVETSLNRMANSLSGTKLIQDATVMAQAVEQIGGTSKLTTNELASLGSKANEAVEKMKRLGMEVPPGLQAIADATKSATHETAGLTGVVERLTERFVVYETLRHIFDFAKDAIESTARIKDLSLATGISTEAIQRLSFVGKEFGVDAEQMVRGVEQLSAKLASGDKNAVAAVNALGLSVKDLIAQGPQETFLQTAEAAGRVESPMLKGGLAADLFGGKLAKTLLPALTDLRKAIDDVPKVAIISDVNIEQVKRFDTALSQLSISAKAVAIEGFGFLRDALTFLIPNFVAFSTTHVPRLTQAFEANAQTMKSHGAATTGMITAADLMKNTLESWKKDALEPLTDAQIQGINVGLQYGKSTAEIAKAINASEIAVQQYTKASEEQLAMYDTSIEAAKQYKAVLDELHKVTFGLAMERQKQWREEAQKTLIVTNDVELKEIAAQAMLNAEYGRSYDGQIKVSSAAETLRQALIRLHLTKVEGISQEREEQVLVDAFTRSLYEEATANDALVKAATTTFAVVGHGVQTYGALTDSLAGFRGELRLGISTLEDYNKAITAFFDQFVGTAGGVGQFTGASQVGIPVLGPTGPRAPSIRDSGGPVTGGQSYLIGMNRQPELFTPGANGFVTPLGASSSAGPTTINLVVDGRVLARVVTAELTRTMKTSRLFPAA